MTDVPVLTDNLDPIECALIQLVFYKILVFEIKKIQNTPSPLDGNC